METIIKTEHKMLELLAQTEKKLIVAKQGNQLSLHEEPAAQLPPNSSIQAVVPAIFPEQLGDSRFRSAYKAKYAYVTGAMANGIASPQLVIAMGKAGMLASFGAGILNLKQIEKGILKIKSQLGSQPFMVNLLHNPQIPAMEQQVVDIFLKNEVKGAEVSAFMDLTLPLVEYRLKGLYQDKDGLVKSHHKIMAKISSPKVAIKFMQPAPVEMVNTLYEQGKISEAIVNLSKHIAMADDIVVEADSAGHTDNRPLVVLLPTIIQLKNKVSKDFPFADAIRIGAAGGISTPESALAAFTMGASFIMTGSINQACTESGTSDEVRKMLAETSSSDVEMAPAADMFEMGVKLQVLKRGTMYPMRAQLLYDLYKKHNSIDEIPANTIQKLEKQFFQAPIEQVWQGCIAYFENIDPRQIAKAEKNPKHKMALIFRSYLGRSSAWATQGIAQRKLDYQIWVGPSMGAFNQWVAGSYLENYQSRHVADIAEKIMHGCAFEQRKHILRLQGINLPELAHRYPIKENHYAHRN